MTFISRIKQLRKDAGLSQQNVADAIGIARATYASIETGKQSPRLDEITNLARYYELSPIELISPASPTAEGPTVEYSRTEETLDIEPRDIDPKINPEKLREVLLYTLGKVGAKPNVGETVLYKFLYFIDMDYYEKNGKSITGLTYIHNTYGPSPVRDFKAVVEDMQKHDEIDIIETKFFNNTQKKYLPQAAPTLKQLSAPEVEHINEVLARLGDKTARELSDLSHKDTPWILAAQGKAIDYRNVFYRTSATAVTELDDEL